MEYSEAKIIVNWIQEIIKGLYVTGSYRRKEPIINDLEFITKKSLNIVLREFEDLLIVGYEHQPDPYAKYFSFQILVGYKKIKVDIWRAYDDREYFFKKFNRDLDKGHLIYYEKLAIDKGLKLTENGLYRSNDRPYDITTKRDLLHVLKH